MPIDFPNNPISGQTYSYAGQQWEYNGVAWDKTSSGGAAGATGATGATGPQGEPGQSSNYYNYKVHTTTQTPPPGNGEIRYNNATQTSSTLLYVKHLDDNGDDIDVFLSLLKQNDNLIIQDASDSNNYQTWKITSAPTVILNDYTTIPVTGVTSAGTGTSGFANNHSVLFVVFSSPIATQYVESIRGLTGAVGLTNGSGIGLSVSGQTLTISNTGVLSVNGSTGSVVTYAGTTGNIQFRYNNGVTANNYFTLESGNLGEITEVLSLSGPTSSVWYHGNQEAIGLQIKRVYDGLGLDESGGVQIKVLGIGNDAGDIYASTLRITTPYSNAGGSVIILDAGGLEPFSVAQSNVLSVAYHQFGSGINSYNPISTNAFAGPIIAAGATFSSLVRFNAGISAAGGTFGSSGVHVGGNITTSSSGAIESGFNGHFRGLQWIDPFGGRSRIVHNYNSFPHSIDFRVHGASFDASGEISRMQIFASGVSFSQGATFRNSINITGNVIASGGISAAGGTFNTNISVNGARIGRTGSNYLFGQDVALTLTTGTNNFLLGASAGHGITSQSNNIAIGNNALRSTTPRERCVALGDSALLNNTQNDSVAIGFNAAYNNTGQYTVALGTEALFNNSANTCMAMGYGALKNNAASGNVAVGPFALNGNNNAAASNNIAIGSNTLFANQGGFRNVAIGNDTLVGGAAYTGQQGARNTVIGHLAGFNNRIGNENVFIGNEAGYGNSSGSNNVFIGSGASGSASGTTTREIVIGSNALGLGSNTAVIGATSQTSATIYGLLNAPGGISAAGGTFSGTISLNGQTFTNVVHGLNGYTGNIGAPQWPVGQTSGALTVLTFPSGVTSFSTKIPFYLPYQNVSAAGSITGTVSTNRVYFTLFNTPRTINIHTLRFAAFNTGITGSCHFGIYSADSDAGLPKSLLYSSASTIVGSGFATTSVTNASGLLTISPGYFYIAVVFNNTPTLYGLNNAQLPIFGSNQYTAGYLNSSPFADMTGFTLPTSLPASGVTFGLIDYIPGAPALRGVFTEYRIV